jgi:hypothetical protein
MSDGGQTVDSYIIRIYRRGNSEPEDILGVLERTSDGTREPFRSRDELWTLLGDELPREIKQIKVAE